MTRNNSDNDLNHDLGKDFALGSLALNIKRTIKNKYLEACKMEKEKQGKKIDYVTSLFMVVQSDLKDDCNEESSVVGVSFDCQQFGLDYPMQLVLCSNGLTYRRMISPEGCSKFYCTTKKEIK